VCYAAGIKNTWAVSIYKNVVGCLGMRGQQSHLDFVVMNLTEAFKSIGSLPGGPLR